MKTDLGSFWGVDGDAIRICEIDGDDGIGYDAPIVRNSSRIDDQHADNRANRQIVCGAVWKRDRPCHSPALVNHYNLAIRNKRERARNFALSARS